MPLDDGPGHITARHSRREPEHAETIGGGIHSPLCDELPGIVDARDHDDGAGRLLPHAHQAVGEAVCQRIFVVLIRLRDDSIDLVDCDHDRSGEREQPAQVAENELRGLAPLPETPLDAGGFVDSVIESEVAEPDIAVPAGAIKHQGPKRVHALCHHLDVEFLDPFEKGVEVRALYLEIAPHAHRQLFVAPGPFGELTEHPREPAALGTQQPGDDAVHRPGPVRGTVDDLRHEEGAAHLLLDELAEPSEHVRLADTVLATQYQAGRRPMGVRCGCANRSLHCRTRVWMQSVNVMT
ncbi:hypothetical protein [Nocardia sp. NPDC057227]|uniref:hypothetical protein n=1 Tax=Nocardia sp. NPDC057227 TaxID=3346056 RepID=UPI003635DAFF